MIEKYDFLRLSDGNRLRIKAVNNNKKQWLVVVHGLGEHFERHMYLTDVLGEKYNYLFFDQRGHGMSSGRRATIDYFSRFSEDLVEVINYLHASFEVDSYGICSHSMGSLVVCDFYKNFLSKTRPPQAIVLLSPALGFPGFGKVLQYSPSTITSYIKDIPWSFDVDGDADYQRYSHNPQVLEDLWNDPLINRHTESKLMMEIVHKANELVVEPVGFNCPTSVIVAGADKVVCADTTMEYFTKTQDVDQLLVIPGAFHEIFMEISKYRVPMLESIKSFFSRHLQETKSSDKTDTCLENDSKVPVV